MINKIGSEFYKRWFPSKVTFMPFDELKEQIEFKEYELKVMKQEMWRRKNL